MPCCIDCSQARSLSLTNSYDALISMCVWGGWTSVSPSGGWLTRIVCHNTTIALPAHGISPIAPWSPPFHNQNTTETRTCNLPATQVLFWVCTRRLSDTTYWAALRNTKRMKTSSKMEMHEGHSCKHRGRTWVFHRGRSYGHLSVSFSL